MYFDKCRMCASDDIRIKIVHHDTVMNVYIVQCENCGNLEPFKAHTFNDEITDEIAISCWNMAQRKGVRCK